MPVRSSSSSVLRWPDRDTVDRAVRAWSADLIGTHPAVERAGYFGSYARDDWGVGSDLDLIVIVDGSAEPFTRRALAFDTLELPVPADLLVYTVDEWRRMRDEGVSFATRVEREAVWVLDRGNPDIS